MSLFEERAKKILSEEAPLALRMRPRNLDEFVGQEEILGKGKLLRRAIEADRLSSLILYGPPGTGKTALAYVIANTTKSHFERLNAVTAGVGDIRILSQGAKERRGMEGKKTILFIDEIAPLTDGKKIPASFYDCMIMGASRGVTVVAVSQRPKDIHNIILSEAYTKLLFRLNLEDDRKKIKGIAGQEVADALYNLPNTYFYYVRADGYHELCRLKSDKKG